MLSAATWMQLEIIILSQVSQKVKTKYHKVSLICGHLYGTNETYLENGNRLTNIDNRLEVAKGGREWDGLGVWG